VFKIKRQLRQTSTQALLGLPTSGEKKRRGGRRQAPHGAKKQYAKNARNWCQKYRLQLCTKGGPAKDQDGLKPDDPSQNVRKKKRNQKEKEKGRRNTDIREAQLRSRKSALGGNKSYEQEGKGARQGPFSNISQNRQTLEKKALHPHGHLKKKKAGFSF